MFTKKSTPEVPSKQRITDVKPSQPLFDKPSFNVPTAPAALSMDQDDKPVTAKIEPNKSAAAPAAIVTPPPAPQPAQPVAASSTTTVPTEKDSGMTQQTPMQPPAPSFRPDLVRTDFRSDASREATRRAEATTGNPGFRKAEEASEGTRKLTVGRDITLSGEISACDILVVEGTVEARVREGRHIEISESGLFKGTVEIDEADIAGRFEGDITVRGRLRVRSSGRIDGKVQYGELEVEAGGHIEGEVHGLKKAGGGTQSGGLKPRTIGVTDTAASSKAKADPATASA